MNEFIRARLRSFGYAIAGIGTLIRTQANARIHLLATVVVVTLGFVLEVSRGEWCALLLAGGMVWLAEGMNTALEFLVDLVSPEHHPLAGKAKDVAAGAVLLAALFAAAVGLLIFLPRIS